MDSIVQFRIFFDRKHDVLRLIQEGNKLRTTAATNMNEHSSRSHAAVVLYLAETVIARMDDGSSVSAKGKSSTIKLVDLAGSERQTETGAKGDRLKEASSINQSLSTLRQVIDFLTDPKKRGKLRA